ncbi:Hypothetical protein, putative [Bodo saltans]|uniref:Uncharacterized protein n=1 Tax=Bodo saltans TaxID=75058 RepID=A0A0S4IXY4_BODSA|nr:Hypothetical protein, putative [Bodo saltans]|eukprot:CUG07128.1 Hypothetical protein, putative [Bodo saltans]
MEVWYTTALQQQGDESGQVAQGLLTRLKPTSNQKNTSTLTNSIEMRDDQHNHSNSATPQQRLRNEAPTAASKAPSSTEEGDAIDVDDVVDVDHEE